MVTITECNRTNLCYDCTNIKCLHAGEAGADCPKWKCDHLTGDCDNCAFIKQYRKQYREQQNKQSVRKNEETLNEDYNTRWKL